MSLEKAAKLIADLRRQRQSIMRLPDNCKPQTEEDAYALQAKVADLLKLEVAAWKVSASGPRGATAAPILAGRIFNSPAAIETTSLLETEIALKLNRDLPIRSAGGYTREDILEGIEAYALAFELVDYRLSAPDMSFPERLADCLANDGLVLGVPQPFTEDFTSPVHKLSLFFDSTPEPFKPADIDPVESLRAYASIGGDALGGLKAGQWVITGSMTGMQKVNAAGTWQAFWDSKLDVSLDILGATDQ
ncbi:hypothetical protein [Roseibium algae]|uniref:2-keto-4-pentenoate hydratase n=1 Tax=Roseibium algae TaxID=3123038 RepID=A0ABU8TI34_9HYPH